MPCYTVENANAQRGEGVFDASIEALRVLNSLGYGSELSLHLVYNPVGAFLPGPQAELEADYKRELKQNFGIVFNNLDTITKPAQPVLLPTFVATINWKKDMQLLVAIFIDDRLRSNASTRSVSVGPAKSSTATSIRC